jgi:DUF2939 family protein
MTGGIIMTRTGVWVVLVIIVLTYVCLPYYHSYSLYNAIQDGDQVVLDERIDFESVRQSLKDQFKSMMAKDISTSKELEDNPFAKMLGLFMTKLIDPMVDLAITPAGLSQIVNEGKLSQEAQSPDKSEFEFDDIDYAFFNSPTSFIVEKSDVTFRLKFKDWGWKLTNIYINEEALDISDDTSKLAVTQESKPSLKEDPNDKKIESIRNKIRGKEHLISELEKKRSEHQEFSSKFEIHDPKFYWNLGDYRDEPVIDFTIVNNTGVPVSRLFFHGKVITEGRAIPWIDDTFNYSVSGGLENSEKKHLQLAPNRFGKWGNSETKNRKDLMLEVKVVNADGADEKELIDDFDKYDSEKLEELSNEVTSLQSELDNLTLSDIEAPPS